MKSNDSIWNNNEEMDIADSTPGDEIQQMRDEMQAIRDELDILRQTLKMKEHDIEEQNQKIENLEENFKCANEKIDKLRFIEFDEKTEDK